MNIGLDLRLFGYQHGGIGRYAKELFPRILELDKENRYFLFVNEKEREKLLADLKSSADNIQIIPCDIRHYSLREQLSFYKVLNKYNLDLVHFPNFNVPILYKKPFVVTIHDMVHHKIGGAKKSHFLHFLAYKKVIQNAARKAKKLLASQPEA